MGIQIRITVSTKVDELLSKIANRLGKKKSTLTRELMEQKLFDLKLLRNELEALLK